MTPQQQAREWLSGPIAVLDVESTGLESWSEVVEISVVDEFGQTLIDTLVKPKRKIPADATAIHGISNAMVSNAPTWVEIHDRVAEAVSGRTVIVYNLAFDRRVMAHTAALYGLPPIEMQAECAMLLYAEYADEWDDYRGSYRWHKLINAARREGVVIEGQAHRALADVQMTLGVIKAMASSED